jgi:hypothetical protein
VHAEVNQVDDMPTDPTLDPRWGRAFSRRTFLRGTGVGLAAFGSLARRVL